MNKILTIIIPTYNMEKYLRRCLDSLIIDEEGMKQLEVLVINDGSKDSSSQIAHEYQSKYPNTFRVIDKENGNYGSCINRGLKEATGKYVKILDADDCYYNENIPEFLNILSTSVADIVFSPFDIYTFDSILTNKMQCVYYANGKTFNLGEIEWTNKIEKNYRAMHCMAVSTDVLRNNGYYQTEGISYTDTQFIFYSVLYSKDCTFYNKPIYKYYLGRDEQTMSVTSMKKTYMHFYKNARVMMDTYMTLPETIAENKRYLLFASIRSCFSFYINTVLMYIFHPVSQIKLANELLNDAKKCKLQCPLNDISRKEHVLYLWKKMHFPPILIYVLVKINQLLYKLHIKKIK